MLVSPANDAIGTPTGSSDKNKAPFGTWRACSLYPIPFR